MRRMPPPMPPARAGTRVVVSLLELVVDVGRDIKSVEDAGRVEIAMVPGSEVCCMMELGLLVEDVRDMLAVGRSILQGIIILSSSMFSENDAGRRFVIGQYPSSHGLSPTQHLNVQSALSQRFEFGHLSSCGVDLGFIIEGESKLRFKEMRLTLGR